MMPNKNDYDDPDFNPFEEDETDGTLYPDASSLNEELGESSDDAHSGKGASRPAAGRADFRSSSLVPEDYLDSHDGSDDSKPNKGPFIGESSFDETVLGESDIDNPAEDFAESMGGNSYPDEGSLDGRPIVSKDSGTLNPAGIIGESSFDETVLSQSDIDEGTEAYSESMKQDVLSGDDFQDDIGTDGDRSGSGGKSNQKGGSGGAIGHVASDSSIHEETVRLSESMGGLGDDMDEFEEFVSAADDGSDSDASDQPGRSSQIWRSSSKTGSSEAPVRKISGEAPFGQSPGADYVVQEKLAEGGMGAVYIAKQVSLNRTLAIKTLKPLKDEDRRALEKSGRLTQRTRQLKEGFLSEAQVTANLVHPNIVPIHDLAQTEEGIPFYSMKLVNGAEWSSPKRNKSRKDLMDDPIRKMSLEENLDVLLKVCDGMAYAHSEGVVNRDLKPENVVVGDFGEVIILDWGLAVPAQDSVRNKLASPTASFGAGTAFYMAPELWTGPAEAIGRHSDIYLLGAMLFEVLSGVPPHEFPEPPREKRMTKSDRLKLMNDVIAANLIRTTNMDGQQLEESELLKIALKAMATKSNMRYHSVQEFQAAIREYQRHEESRHLTRRADSLMDGKTGAKTEGYEDYQTATALYEEALRGWPKNESASEGLFFSKLKYAELANTRGDFDLGLQLVEGRKAKEYVAVAKKLEAGKSRRGRAKWTIASLLGIILIAGPASAIYMYQKNNENLQLLGDVAVAEQKVKDADKVANEKIAAAETEANQKIEEADQKVVEIQNQSAEDIRVAKANNDEAIKRANDTNAEAMKLANMKNAEAMELARQENERKIKEEKEIADAKVLEQQMLAMDAEKQRKEAAKAARIAEATAAFTKIVAEKDSLIQTANYSKAIETVESILSSDKFLELPEDIQVIRRSELEAQKNQLTELNVRAESPIQSQRISRDRSLIAFLQSNAKVSRISVRQLDSATGAVGAALPAEFVSNNDTITDLLFDPSGKKTILCAAGNKVISWDYEQDTKTTLAEANSNILVMTLAGETLVTADEKGLLQIWNLTTGEQASSNYPSGTTPSGLAYLPQKNILIMIGSRADTSADVLAFDLVDTGLKRRDGGQLKYTPKSIAPPKAIAISPNGEVAVISNARNGSFLVLPNGDGGFPFLSPAELEKNGSGWIKTEHSRPVNAIAFSRDGKFFATASDDLTVRVWRVTGSETNQVSAVEHVFPDDDKVVALRGHGAPVTDVAFLDNDNTLLSTSRDRWCRTWKLDSYLERHQQIIKKGKLAEGESVSSIPDEQEQVDEKQHVSVRRYRSSKTQVLGLSDLLRVSTNLDRTAVRASKSVTQDWQSLPRMARPRHLLTAGTLPAGTLPAAPTELNVVTLNATDQRQRGGIKSLDLNEDGTRIVTGAADGAAVMWDATTGAVIRDLDMKEEYYHNRSRLFEEGHKFNISKLDFVGPNQSLCLSTSFDGSLCLWQADQSAGDFGTEKCRLTHLRLFNAFGASPDGTFVVTSAALPPTSESISKQNQHPCVQWDIAQLITGETPTPVTTFSGFHKDFVTTVAVSADNLVVATGAKDGYVAFWEPGTGRQLGNVRAHTDKTLVTNIVWVDESSFISTGVDGQIRLWSITRDPSSGLIEANEVLGYAGNTKSPVDSIALSPNRHQFLTIHANFVKEQGKSDTQYSVSLWNISEKRKVRNLQLVASGNSANAENLVSSVAWSTDGNQVAMVSGGQIILYDTSDWSVARVLRRSIRSDVTADQETADVASARFATLGTTELLATFDGNATQLWDLNSPTKESSQLVTTFRPQQSVSVSSLSKDPKHAFLATGSRGLRIFDADERSSSYGQTMCKKDSPHRGYVSALEFSGETDLIASGGTDGGIVFWNWNPTARKLTELGNANFGIGAIVDVKWSADSRSVLVVGQKSAKLLSRPADNSFDIQRWGSTDLHISAAAEDTVKLTCGDISTDGGSISIALAGKFENTDGSVGYVLTKDPGAETFGDPLTFSGHGAGGISAVEFFDGEYVAGARYLVSTGIDGAAIIWNWTSGTPYQAYRFLTPGLPGAAHLAAITDLAVSRSGHIATCSDDGTAIIWRSPFSVTEVGVQPN